MTRNNVIKLVMLIILLLSILFAIFYWVIIKEIIYPFIISIFAAYLLNPLVCKMEQKGIKRSAGIFIIYLVLMMFAFFICFYVIPAIVRDLGKLSGVMPEYSRRFNGMVQYIQDKYSESGLPESIKSAIDNNIKRIENYLTDYIEGTTSLILDYVSKFFSFVLIPVILYYFLKDFRLIVNKLKLLIPHKYRGQLTRILSNIDSVFGDYIRSQIILSLIIGAMTSLALFILKINFALVIGVLNGITNIIPYFGPIIGTIPAVFIALLQSPTKAVYTLIAMTIIQQIESDIISPKITADCVGIHPVTVILALIIGGELFGLTGMVLGVPAAAAIKIIYNDVMKNMF